jgi:hypothetical protein
MLDYRDEWAFVSPHDGLGGPPSFVACMIDTEQRMTEDILVLGNSLSLYMLANLERLGTTRFEHGFQ